MLASLYRSDAPVLTLHRQAHDQFLHDKVRERGAGVACRKQAPRIVVLPVWSTDSGAGMGQNPWRRAWQDLMENTVVPIMMPLASQ
jgi:hypothetical protein